MVNQSSTAAARPRRRSSEPEPPSAFSNWRSWLLGLLLVAALVFAVLHWGDVKKFAELVSKAQPLWLIAALAAQLATYVALAAQWTLVLRAADCAAPRGKLLALTMTKHFADQMVPTAGMSGNVVVVDRLRSIGASRPKAIATVIMTIIAYYAAYAVAALAALVLLWWHGRVNWFTGGLVSIFLVVAAAIPSLSLWLQDKGEKAIPPWLRRFGVIREPLEMVGDAPEELVRDPRLLTLMTALNAAVFVADALTLQFCLRAIGVSAAFDVCYLAFIMGSIVVTVAPIPMGLGSFEAVSIGTLRVLGVPFEAALSAVLLFRGFTLWLPLIPGLITSRRDLKRRKKAKA
jgi:uncharacterized protein (TIRG00374 family)